MKRTKEEKRLAVLVHNAAFEQAKEDARLIPAPAELFLSDVGPRGTTTPEEAETIAKEYLGARAFVPVELTPKEVQEFNEGWAEKFQPA